MKNVYDILSKLDSSLQKLEESDRARLFALTFHIEDAIHTLRSIQDTLEEIVNGISE